jgi:dihydrofolate synthase/folylpolyglutamate synthase
LAEGEGAGSPGVLVTGSVVAVGEARTLLVSKDKDLEVGNDTRDYPDDDWDMAYADSDTEDPFHRDEELR